MGIAHYFTIFRILLIPLFPVIYYKFFWFGIPDYGMPFVLIGILIICEFTDVADGFIARKKNQVTDLGKVLDPMADSIMRITVFFTFTQGLIALPLIIPFIFMYRDFLISTLRTLCALRGVTLAARKSGKVKAVVQAIAAFSILILMVFYFRGELSLEALQQVSLVISGVTAGYAVLAAVEYLYANSNTIRKSLTK